MLLAGLVDGGKGGRNALERIGVLGGLATPGGAFHLQRLARLHGGNDLFVSAGIHPGGVALGEHFEVVVIDRQLDGFAFLEGVADDGGNLAFNAGGNLGHY